jgi:hypothetical protein
MGRVRLSLVLSALALVATRVLAGRVIAQSGAVADLRSRL